ncbi:MAG: GFA family protein [Pseudomonadota bacterium]|nr:GFA family protein [Pseudomonadota bacterium]
MEIEGSCYCGHVEFSAVSHTPCPYMRCYCSMCRKTAGGGGYAINIMAAADTLAIEGKEYVAVHDNWVDDEDHPGALKRGPGKGYYCRDCGSALWAADPRWPQWVYPFASAVDTPLPRPPELVHIMLDFVAPWVEVPSGEGHRHFSRYPDESIEDWHKRHGLYQP